MGSPPARPFNGPRRSPNGKADRSLAKNKLSHNFHEEIAGEARDSLNSFEANIEQVLEWMSTENYGSGVSINPLKKSQLSSLMGGEQLFIIDNSASTKQHRKSMRNTLEALIYLVKDLTEISFGLLFTNRIDRGGHVTFLDIFDAADFSGDTNIEKAQNDIGNQMQDSSRFKWHLDTRPINGKSIYILTDGIWSGDEQSLCGMDSLIQSLATMYPESRFGIQFIQFGHDLVGTQRLMRLANLNLDMDNVDTEHYSGNVYKMLLGHYSHKWNGEISDIKTRIEQSLENPVNILEISPSDKRSQASDQNVTNEYSQVHPVKDDSSLLGSYIEEIKFSTSVDISDNDNKFFINKIKIAVEKYTALQWNWWPLEPCMRPLGPEENRLIWTCTCGTRLWKEISLADAQLIRGMLPELQSKQHGAPRCRVSTQKGSFWTQITGKFSGPTTQQRSSGQQKKSTQPPINNASNSGQLPSMSLANQPQSSSTSSNPVPVRWILFGAEGSRQSIELEQIEIHKYINDSSFFRILRQHYRKHRGKFGLWFSVWRLGSFDGMKFERRCAKMIFPHSADGVPDGSEHEYDPKPSTTSNPLISRHETLNFMSCDRLCHAGWKLLSHECGPEPTDTRTIKRIPKRSPIFDTDSEKEADSRAWGLQARYEISAAGVIGYHLLIVTAPFIFWAWWQSRHPDDLQNASIPATAVLALISLFWSATGILTQRRHSGARDV